MLLLDTDVLIDLAFDREPYAGPASEIIDQLEHGGPAAAIAWHTVANFYYVVRPTLGPASAREFIVDLTRFVKVAEAGTEAIQYAAGLPMSDFEDAMQVAAARACGAKAIVTRNVKDFQRSPILAVSPEDALAEYF